MSHCGRSGLTTNRPPTCPGVLQATIVTGNNGCVTGSSRRACFLLAANPYMLFMLLDVTKRAARCRPIAVSCFAQFVERLLLREQLFAWGQRQWRHWCAIRQAKPCCRIDSVGFAMQPRRVRVGGRSGITNDGRWYLTVLPLTEAAEYLTDAQLYQAASANLLTVGDEHVRFAHQLLQEYSPRWRCNSAFCAPCRAQ